MKGTFAGYCLLALGVGLFSCRTGDEIESVEEPDLADFLAKLCMAETVMMVFDCVCQGSILTREQCQANTDSWVASARELQLEYDSSCMLSLDRRYLDFVSDSANPCSLERADELAWVSCEHECQVYFGTVVEGERCERAGRRMSTCEQGLACGADGRCYRPCDVPLAIPEGGACGYTLGLRDEACASPTVCSGDPGTCVVPAVSGDACDPMAPTCDGDDACFADSNTCAPKLELGEPCVEHVECASGVCVDGCQPPDPYRCAGYFW